MAHLLSKYIQECLPAIIQNCHQVITILFVTKIPMPFVAEMMFKSRRFSITMTFTKNSVSFL